jgi:hypothetical protein
MNTGYWVAGLGVLGLAVGVAMYAADWHKTIGEGGIGLGIVLILAGIWLSRGTTSKKAVQVPQPTATT